VTARLDTRPSGLVDGATGARPVQILSVPVTALGAVEVVETPIAV
jgi:hypothetical protein